MASPKGVAISRVTTGDRHASLAMTLKRQDPADNWETMSLKNREKEISEPKPFGVEYVPHKRRLKAKPGEPVCVAKVSEIPPGKAKAVEFHNFKLAVFNVGGTFYAIKDACPHAQYPLSNGKLTDEVVTCSSHSWRFNVRTGTCLKGPEREMTLRTFAVEVRGDELWIRP